jgi:hypothetical protein
MILMDDEVICENEIGYTGQVHLKQACGFVATIPNKPFIAPDGSIRLSDVGGQIRKERPHQGGPSFLKMTYGSYAD